MLRSVHKDHSSSEPVLSSWGGRPAWAEIDLDALTGNVRALKALVGPGVELMAVVKANAYGLGAVPVAAAAHAAGASWVAVSCVDEGIELRQAGLRCPLLVLGYTPPWEAERIVVNTLTPTVMSHPLAAGLATVAAELGVVQSVQVKVDTGMGRYGLLPDETVPFVKQLLRHPSLHLQGIYTHFARADEADKGPTYRQLAVFRQVLAELRVSGIEVPMCHAANTAATLDVPEAHLDAVRCGIGLAGLYPSSDTQRSADLHPVLRLKARVARVRRLAAGESIGYGGTFVLERPANVALMPIGYADGLPLALSNRGVVLVGGRRAPIVGRVSMDQTTMLLGDESIEPEAEVVLLGRQAAEEITAEELAALAGTSHYEFVTRIPPRLPRVYLRDGAAVQVQTLLGTQRL